MSHYKCLNLISVQCAELHFYFFRFALCKYTIIIILLQAIALVNFPLRDRKQRSTKGPTDTNGFGCGWSHMHVCVCVCEHACVCVRVCVHV